MQLVFFFAILLCFLMPIKSHRKASLASSSDSTTFLSRDDFSRAQNMNFTEVAESAPVPVPLNDPEVQSNSYYEGDMMIMESDENKVAMYTAKRWPHGRIPYIMENKFAPEERAAIARGIMILQERTCIRFVPKKAHDEDYVLMRRGPGCAAHVGRIGGQQWVILGDGCYGIETVTHELMHSVGFIHEQSRPDRDDHVEIVWDNIKSSAKRNFKKHQFDYLADHGFPYDLLSVMHYRQYAFSKNRKPTILPKRPVPYLRCRGIDCPSELDIKKINFLYKCHKKEDDFDAYDKDFENEVTVDDIMVGGKGGHNDGLDEHFNPDMEADNEPCLEGENCHYKPSYKLTKSLLYPPSFGKFAFDDTRVHPRVYRKLPVPGNGQGLPLFYQPQIHPAFLHAPVPPLFDFF